MEDKLRRELETLQTIAKKLVAEKLSDDTDEYSSKEIDEVMKKISKIERELTSL